MSDTPKTDAAFEAAKTAAEYCYGKPIGVQGWRDIACAMRDDARNQERHTNMHKTIETAAPGWLGWAFAQTDDEENWIGPCDTRDAAIEEAWDYYGDEQSIAVAPCYKPGPDDDDDCDFVVRGHRETIEPNIVDQPPRSEA